MRCSMLEEAVVALASGTQEPFERASSGGGHKEGK